MTRISITIPGQLNDLKLTVHRNSKVKAIASKVSHELAAAGAHVKCVGLRKSGFVLDANDLIEPHLSYGKHLVAICSKASQLKSRPKQLEPLRIPRLTTMSDHADTDEELRTGGNPPSFSDVSKSLRVLKSRMDPIYSKKGVRKLRKQIFELEAMMRIDFRSNTVTIQDALQRINQSLRFLNRLEIHAAKKLKNSGRQFQELKSRASISCTGGGLQRTPHSRIKGWDKDPDELELERGAKHLVELIRVKIEDTNDLNLAKRVLFDAKNCLQSLKDLANTSERETLASAYFKA